MYVDTCVIEYMIERHRCEPSEDELRYLAAMFAAADYKRLVEIQAELKGRPLPCATGSR
jgi:hypothetical protein